MKRKVHMNYGRNVQMYATESSGSPNTNNCASGCGTCSSGSTPSMGGALGGVLGAVVGSIPVIIETVVDPDN